MDSDPMIASGQPADGDEPAVNLDPPLSDRAILVLDVGNSSITVGAWDAMSVHASRSVAPDDRTALSASIQSLGELFPNGRPLAVAMASVVPEAEAWTREAVASLGDSAALLVGDDLPLPMPVALGRPDQIGTDRVCAAAAAFERTQHACTVVDFGTAVTVDLVDDDGTFAGGAIFPGLGLQARILSEGTAKLPLIVPTQPEQAVGRDTSEAIRSGLCFGLPGAVRALVERYASELGTWPQVVATGGDLPAMLELCDFIDTPVPDLTLMGVGLAYARSVDATRS
ncbi:MAG: type III pantothenate kinase [Phycisphaerae bacterium]